VWEAQPFIETRHSSNKDGNGRDKVRL
jgi:hypothetical protein